MENVDNTSDTVNAPDAGRAQPENQSDIRNRNLKILNAYIHRQRALLERIKQDVDRLQASKADAVASPSSALSRVLHDHNTDNCESRGENEDGVRSGFGRLSELVRDVNGVGEATITKDIDWGVFKGHDITPLHSLQPWPRTSVRPSGTHLHMPPPPTPSTPSLISPKSSLSSFVSLDSFHNRELGRKESSYQAHVREMRVKIVDPALTIAAQFLATLPLNSDDEARANDAREKEARRVKVQSSKPDGVSTTNGHVKKSASRRKSEASAAAAALRPRGQGGRFRKKEPVVTEIPVPQSRAAGASSASDLDPVPASTSESPIRDPSSSTQHNTTSFVVSHDEELRPLEGGRPRRARRPSTRYGSTAPSVSSMATTQSGSSVFATGNGKAPMRLPSSSPGRPSGPSRTRLTIRIPARTPTKSAARNGEEFRERQASISTFMSATASLATTESSHTSTTVSGEIGDGILGGKECGNWATGKSVAAALEESRSSSPATTTRSASRARFPDVKCEEVESVNGMDVDDEAGWGAVEGRNGRFKRDRGLGSFRAAQPLEYGQADVMTRGKDQGDSRSNVSDDSFVCERLPAPPGSSASSPSVARNGANGNANANYGSSRRGNPSSKTFNVTWSDEEQRLLDMLLEQFPDGTKNRWANISRAMGGARTPRQVASRVQKYFAKMKKWGIDVT